MYKDISARKRQRCELARMHAFAAWLLCRRRTAQLTIACLVVLSDLHQVGHNDRLISWLKGTVRVCVNHVPQLQQSLFGHNSLLRPHGFLGCYLHMSDNTLPAFAICSCDAA